MPSLECEKQTDEWFIRYKRAHYPHLFMEPTTDFIQERNKTHGEFRNNSQTSQLIKVIIRMTKNWESLPSYKKEGLEMIIHKIGRALEGDPNHQDHWDDIMGYARLVADRNKEDNGHR